MLRLSRYATSLRPKYARIACLPLTLHYLGIHKGQSLAVPSISDHVKTMTGYFITFEGIEGCGKSTQCQAVAAALRRAGISITVSREPGGTHIGERIRALLLDVNSRQLYAETELLLYAADRAQHVRQVLRPALEAGSVVLCDRFADSTFAYQGYGRGLDMELIRRLNTEASGALTPNLTILLDVPVEIGLGRITERGRQPGGGRDRLEQEHHAFHERVRQGYLALASAEPDRMVVIDASDGIDALSARVLRTVNELLAAAFPAQSEPLNTD